MDEYAHNMRACDIFRSLSKKGRKEKKRRDKRRKLRRKIQKKKRTKMVGNEGDDFALRFLEALLNRELKGF